MVCWEQEVENMSETCTPLFGQDVIDACRQNGWARGALIPPGEPIHAFITGDDGAVRHEVIENNYPKWTWEDRMRMLREQFGEEVPVDDMATRNAV